MDNVTVEKKTRNVLFLSFEGITTGWEQWFMLSADRHHDSNECNRALETEHLEKAKARNALILDCGDLFDVMQGRYDPRRSWPEMRPEYFKRMNEEDKSYFDVILDDAEEYYAPYANNIVMLGRGNHDMSIFKHNDIDLMERLVDRINRRANAHVVTGEYGGWVRLQFNLWETQRESFRIKYFHGPHTSANAPVTRGTIQTNRQAIYLPDADLVVNGHIHESWVFPINRERLSQSGTIYQDVQFHVRTGTYRNDYGDGARSWHVEQGKPPKPMGCIWVRFFLQDGHIKKEIVQDLG